LYEMAANLSGARISHFDILEKLGEGGMGAVYKARDHRLDRLVAIKVLAEKAASDPERQARLVQEAKTASALNHPHIVTIYEIDVADGLTFIAMEYIEGRTLERLIPPKGMRLTEALGYAVPAADALAAAHAIGIVHRDVKPENVLVDRRNRVRLVDFGLAKWLRSSGSGEPAASRVAGTWDYMAPEQFTMPESVDHRADIFSTGVVSYEMLTGQVPRKEFPPPSKSSATNARLDPIVLRALERDRERRYQQIHP